ncbi:MAG TPA: peptidoglycan DD-metalloendopeptidase family protein [Casimicrobiaceae bacterium]|nr:peptidoglycan DD-metalloendopeptidase family protein [Casimicrobiaceae bacterium]
MTPPVRISALLAAVAAALVLAGCMTRPPAPVDERGPPIFFPPPSPPPPAAVAREPEAPPRLYTVRRGETLAQIALEQGLDYRELAVWNNIENPNVIRVGQVLVLSPPGQAGTGPGGVVTAPLVTAPSIAPSNEARALMTSPGRGNTPTFKTEPRAMKLPYSDQALAQLERPPISIAAPPAPATAPATAAAPPASATAPPASATAPASTNIAKATPSRPESARVPEIDDAKLDWAWPTSGKVIKGFSEGSNLKGIDIGGKAGQPVLASAAGRVVYAGAGLRGYGKLVIVKHNNTYLSAYAHNREILVKEGQQVSKGQKIGEMGDTDADQVKLHFEIRRLGKPIDPAKFLPPT